MKTQTTNRGNDPAAAFLREIGVATGSIVTTKTHLQRKRKEGYAVVREALDNEQINANGIVQSERKLLRLRKTLCLLAKQKDTAFGCEIKLIDKATREINKTIDKTIGELRKLKKPNSSKARAAVDKSLEQEKELSAKVKGLFPNAKVMRDMSFLVRLKNRQGLPKVALFDLENGVTEYGFGFSSWHLYYSKKGPKTSSTVLSNRDLETILAATGVTLRGLDEKKSYGSKVLEAHRRSQRKISKSNRASANSRTTPSDRNISSASEINIKADFSDISGVIPQSARKVINKAIQSKLFDEVVLLAEVPKWNVTYTDLSREQLRPLIQGTALTSPETRDPLIIGSVLKRGRPPLLYVIGQFNVTKIERWVGKEMTEDVK